MATALKSLSSYNEEDMPSVEGKTFGIVVAEYNAHITHALYEACLETLLKHGAKEEDITTTQVPGAFELPLGARMLATTGKVDAVICLGCVIKGETSHNEYINQAVASGLTSLSVMLEKPFIFGVLTPNDEQQALDRAGGKHGNKGVEAATTAIRMLAIKDSLGQTKGSIGFGA